MISVIIPVWNHASDAIDCLKALDRQTERDFEVILVDDGSTDDLQARLNVVSVSFPLHLLRFDQNRGAPAARNEGFRHARGDLLLFLDADAMLEPQTLAVMKKALMDHPDVAFAYSSFMFGWKKFAARAFDVEALKQGNYIHTSAMLRREVFPGFDESLKRFQDWDLWLTIVERGGRGFAIKETLMRVRVDQHRKTISRWVPAFLFRLPWPLFGYTPLLIKQYREAEAIVKAKHKL